jgi:hypothetical protein
VLPRPRSQINKSLETSAKLTTLGKQPLFEKSGAKTSVMLEPGISNALVQIQGSLFGSFSSEKELLP